MKLSRTIAYAIQAMIQLAEADEGVPIPCSHLSRVCQLPERFLLQVLRNLVTHGLLRSIRGVDGGYMLARPASQINLCEIVDSFDSPLSLILPNLELTPVPIRSRIVNTLQHSSQAARAELRKLSLADLIRNVDEEHEFAKF
jgi:Rrf2 family protein